MLCVLDSLSLCMAVCPFNNSQNVKIDEVYCIGHVSSHKVVVNLSVVSVRMKVRVSDVSSYVVFVNSKQQWAEYTASPHVTGLHPDTLLPPFMHPSCCSVKYAYPLNCCVSWGC